MEQRRKSGREESDKQVNDCGNAALKWKGVKKDKEERENTSRYTCDKFRVSMEGRERE